MSACSSSASAVILGVALNPVPNTVRNLAVFLLPKAPTGCASNAILQLGNGMVSSTRG